MAQLKVDARDRIIEKHSVVPRRICRVLRGSVSYLNIVSQQKIFEESIYLSPILCPQGEMVNTWSLLLRGKLVTYSCRLYTNVTMKKRKSSHVVC